MLEPTPWGTFNVEVIKNRIYVLGVWRLETFNKSVDVMQAIVKHKFEADGQL